MTPESAVADRPTDEPVNLPVAADETTPPIAEPDSTVVETNPVTAETNTTAAETVSPTQAETGELPIHRGKCVQTGCPIGATYRPTASGAGFQILETFGCPPDTAFGSGEHGRPVCPKGHGELTIADDLLSAAEAITAAAERVNASARKDPRLPFPAPEFNAAGVWHSIVGKRHKVKELEREFERADERRKKAKAALDDANTELGQMIDDFEEREAERQFEIERRAAAAAAGHPEDTTLVRCLYERQHEGQTCPLCSGAATFVRGKAIAARNDDRHVEQVAAFLEDLELETLIEALAEVAGIVVVHNAVRDWTAEQRTGALSDAARAGAAAAARG